MSYQTPWSSTLDPGNYRITIVDTTLVVGGQTYTFKGWSDQLPTLQNPRTVPLAAGQGVSLMAVYETQSNVTPQTVTLNAGTHTISMPASYTVGGLAYTFSRWEDNSTNPIRTINLSANKAVTAYYTPSIITLNVVAGTGGTVSPSGSQNLNVGTLYQFTASPATGYVLDHWDLGGVSKGSSNTLSLTAQSTMNGQTLTALFTTIPPQQVSVTVTSTSGGSTDVSGTQTFNVGDTVTITAVAQAGQLFIGWKLNGADYSTENPLHLTVTADMNGKTLTADFTTPTQAGFPIVLVVGVALIGSGYALYKRRKKARR